MIFCCLEAKKDYIFCHDRIREWSIKEVETSGDPEIKLKGFCCNFLNRNSAKAKSFLWNLMTLLKERRILLRFLQLFSAIISDIKILERRNEGFIPSCKPWTKILLRFKKALQNRRKIPLVLAAFSKECYTP